MKKPQGNLLTLLLAAAIIAAGVVLPPLIYPLMDQYSNKITQLQASDTASTVFQEPVSLYPWNVYDESRTRELYPSELNTIIESKVPDFLLGFLLARGVDINSSVNLRQDMLSSFRYLSVNGNSAEDCFVLEMDLNGDGVPDLSCATDLNGNVISTLVLTDDYQTIQVALPTNTGQGAGNDTANADQEAGATGATGATDAAGAGASADADSDAVPSADADATTTGTDTDTLATGDSADTTVLSIPDTNQAPLNENLNLWAFVYTTQKEAESLASPALADSFTQVDDYFQTQLGYVFTNYLRFVYGLPQSSESVNVNTDSNLRLLVLNNSQYQFNIYNLPSEQRVILYLNPQTRACVGFTIQDLENH